ncbi:DUF1275 family protein, partial [Streptomyces sp. IBSBF 2435]|uniref:DUF1275 family protein n=1 Tax=Streptomyces sp. IBSBF 2435 TaxID=2903531 RepID=UPI002FDBE0F8
RFFLYETGRGLLGGLLIETAALWLVVFGWLYWEGSPDAAQRAALLVLTAAAMGCQNGAIRISADGEVTTGYLTGMVTSTVAVLVTQGRVVWRNVGTAVLFTVGAAAAGAAFRWVHLGTPVIPALLVTAALATHEPSAQQR